MNPRTIIVITILTVGAIGSWYLVQSNATSQDDDIPLDPVHRGYYLKQARILGTAEDGNLLYEIEAERAEQQRDDRVDFSEVRIQYAPNSDVPWVITADEATLREGAPRIALRGHVQILNSGESSNEDTEIRTQYLELDPENFLAETNDRVQIRFGSRSVTATGMLASLNDDKIELKSNVRGKIAP